MTTAATSPRTDLEPFLAGHPRGSWSADEYAAAQRVQGTDAGVVMGLGSDQFLVVTDTTTPERGAPPLPPSISDPKERWRRSAGR
ncbi:hypothetical protein J1792_33555 [Streptomyces triculaminicus]|uniref:Uncharacterized protein n=2 Tax=Streptomyces TaxID=1883 RepID=A0A939JUF6_9ACTN|nr:MULTISPECIES: hypothetical protein [Streptomyces]MBO0657465.1 hypothetical protein [Streptomyces triculaminicus]QSY52785.1 hypothetical protein J3S04_32700 [Streptomyces griseocarneus]